MLSGISSGDRLEVEATDPSAEKDFAAFCEASGNKLLDTRRQADVFLFVIEKR
jgi:tRNA 2-thiouridine synthesizing protein A